MNLIHLHLQEKWNHNGIPKLCTLNDLFKVVHMLPTILDLINMSHAINTWGFQGFLGISQLWARVFALKLKNGVLTSKGKNFGHGVCMDQTMTHFIFISFCVLWTEREGIYSIVSTIRMMSTYFIFPCNEQGVVCATKKLALSMRSLA